MLDPDPPGKQAERRAVHIAAHRGGGEAKRLYGVIEDGAARCFARSSPRQAGTAVHPQAQSCSELARPRGFEPLFSP